MKGNREVDKDGLERLLVYAGYDSATGKVTENEFRLYVESICSKVDLTETDQVLEVGCGIGAFLNCLSPTPSHIVGIDYSQSLISRAERLKNNPCIKFFNAEASNFTVLGLGGFDVIFSNSTFFYFPSLDYAAAVCTRSCNPLTSLDALPSWTSMTWESEINS